MTKEEAHFLWSKINRYTSRSVPLRAERPVNVVKKEKEKERTNELECRIKKVVPNARNLEICVFSVEHECMGYMY